MSHRCLSLVLASALAAPLPATGAAASVAASGARPNIVVILSDDMGFSDLGCYGGEIATPHLDALAAGGLRFTQFYNTGRCCPTRASLLTGLYPHQAGQGHMTNPHRDPEGRVSPGYAGSLNRQCVTLAEVLRGAGYRTYAVGKWHVAGKSAPDGPKHNWPLQRGFDRYYGMLDGAGSYYDPPALCRGDAFITPYNDPEYHTDKGEFYLTNAISDNAVAYLNEHDDEHRGEPLLMYVAYTAAHWPMHALPEDIAKYDGAYDQGYDAVRRARHSRLERLGLIPPVCGLSETVGDWGKTPHKAWEKRCMEVYAAMVDCMDQGIGRIVETLRQNGELDNTLVLFLQDNGGCAETVGREPLRNLPGPAEPLADDELQRTGRPSHTRLTGEPVRRGPDAMPGPTDTYIAYGRGWANVSNTPFRWYKHHVHEGGIATPLIAHWPAGIDDRGALRTTPGHLIDVMATCVDLAGAEYPSERDGEAVTPMQGVSLRPLFEGGRLERDTLYWEHEGNRAVRVGDWKLVKRSRQAWELYDLSSDRSELKDLAAEFPDRTAEMASEWEAWAAQALVTPGPFDNPER